MRRFGAILLAGCLYGADLLDQPAINYNYTPVHDPVASLDPKQLKFEGSSGYLRSVLDALHVPVESQIAVFSKTSLQAPLIEPNNPRTIFFNDSVAVGWMKGGFIEIAALDRQQGVQFYTLAQRPDASPRFERGRDCLRCHVGDATLDVAGFVVRSTFTAPDGSPMLVYGGSIVDHRTPVEDRWGGWYVTGSSPAVRHMGNATITPDGDPKSMITPATLSLGSLKNKFDTTAYLSATSDVAALMVFDHQMHMANLMTRVGWDVRAAIWDKSQDLDRLLADTARELVDYMLFVEEAPLSANMQSGSAFVTRFAASFNKNALRDSKGRSLRDLDLQKRLLRYPCSYMIYSEAFDALPPAAKDAIYKRMWQVLSGAEKDKKYARLSAADRRAVVQILRETKKGVPDYFQVVK